MNNKKHLQDKEQQYNWENYYKHLTVKQLTAAITDSYIIAYSTRPGILEFDYWKSEPLYIKNHYIPGLVWRDGKTGRQRPEPAEEEIEKAIDNLYYSSYEGENKKDYINQVGFDVISRRDKKYHISAEVLERYITFHPLILRRIYELTEPLLYGKREDVEQLVNEYQAGNYELLDRINNQLGGIVNKAEKQFSFIGNKEAFTNLAGKFSKRIPKPEGEYSENSPAGDPEEQRLLLTTEPFNFDEVDRRQTVNRALLQALETYRPDQGAQFKTWFYKILEKDFIDLYREYQYEWKKGKVIKSLPEYESLQLSLLDDEPGDHIFHNLIKQYRQAVNKKLNSVNQLEEYLQPAFIDELSDKQKEWIIKIIDNLPYRLRRNVTAGLLKISESTERRRRGELRELFKNSKAIFKQYNNTRIIEKDRGPAVKKWPPQTAEQKARIDNYNNFIKEESFYPILFNSKVEKIKEKQPYYMPVPQLDEWIRKKLDHKTRKADINKISFTIDKKKSYRGFNGQEITRHFKRHYYTRGHKETIRTKEGKFYTMFGEIDIIYLKRSRTDQRIRASNQYCRCGLNLTTTGECINKLECRF